MPRFGLVGPTYQSQSPNLDAQLCMNFYPELDESGAGNSPIALYPTPGTKLFSDLGRTVHAQVDGIAPFEQSTTATGNSNTEATSPLTPTHADDWAFEAFFAANTVPAGWNSIVLGHSAEQSLTGTPATPGAAGLTIPAAWVIALLLFQKFGASSPTVIQTANQSGNFSPPYTFSFPNPVTAGSTIIFTNAYISTGSGNVTLSDNLGNVYVNRASILGNGRKLDVFVAEDVAAGATTFTLGGTDTGNTRSSLAYEVMAGTAAVVQSGPIRGALTVVGRSFFVSGSDFVEVLSNGSKNYWGTVSNDSGPVSMAASPQQLLIASGGVAYIFDLTSNTFSTIPGVTFPGPVNQAGICDDFFLLTLRNSKEFFVSAPLDATDWVTNGSAIVSVYPDNTVSMIVDHREIWFFSDTQSVVYYDSGNIFPFDVISGAFIEAGAAATFATSQLANTVMWLGQDVRGRGKVYMANGYTPQRVSTHAIEFEIQGYSRIDDAESWTYQEDGHDFYVLYFPTPSTTLVYDVTTNMWHKRGFWVESAAIFRAIHARCHTFNFNKHLVGDWQSSKVYQQQIPTQTGTTWDFATDNENPIVRIRRAAHISQEQKRQYINELNVYVETGLGPQPPLLDGDGNPRGPEMVMSISRDGGHIFGYGRTRDCGQSGEYRKRVRWIRLGQARDFVIEIKMADPIGWRIVDAYIGQPEVGDN